METRIKGYCACQPTTNRSATLRLACEDSEEGELAMSLLLAGCVPNNGPKVPVSAIFSSGFAKRSDREAAGCWVVQKFSAGT